MFPEGVRLQGDRPERSRLAIERERAAGPACRRIVKRRVPHALKRLVLEEREKRRLHPMRDKEHGDRAHPRIIALQFFDHGGFKRVTRLRKRLIQLSDAARQETLVEKGATREKHRRRESKRGHNADETNVRAAPFQNRACG